MKMKLLQFAIPEGLAAITAEAATLIAGGATILYGLGLWVNGNGEVERERVGWLVVGVDEERAGELVDKVKEILRESGEKAIFYVTENEPKLEWL